MQKPVLPNSAETELTRQAFCDVHGAYTEHGRRIFGHEVWFGCKACLNAQRVETEKAMRLEEARSSVWTYQQLFGQWIPKAFAGPMKDFYLLDSEMTEAFFTVEKYVLDFYVRSKNGQGLFFTGNAGTGKTKLACGVLQRLFPEIVGCYVTLPDLGDRIRQTWKSQPGEPIPYSEARLVNAVCRTPLLVLDEIGTLDKSNDIDLLFKVIDYRYRNLLPTICISNVGLDGLNGIYGNRVMRRIKERNLEIKFSWKPWYERNQESSATQS